MLSKAKEKFISSLLIKKYRVLNNLFIVEGTKIVHDLLKSSFNVEEIIATENWISNNIQYLKNIKVKVVDNLKKFSSLSTPTEVIAIVKIPDNKHNNQLDINKLYLCLDNIQDPGNLGTIIRISDWFGIDTVFCSVGTADLFNPKTLQATMGSVFRVNVIFTDLVDLVSVAEKKSIPVYGTFLEGENIYTSNLSKNGLIILGNEGHGISDIIKNRINKKLLIPCFSSNINKPESLNVSMAASIVCSEFKRRTF